jgi:dipeptidyl aminopeptidase/acylaminoacyl peptidase
MSRPRLFILLLAILGLIPPAHSYAQFGNGRPKAFGDDKAEPVWLLPPVEGPNLHYKTFKSASVKAAVSYVIYLPAEYETNKSARYPVVYWLHGKGAG